MAWIMANWQSVAVAVLAAAEIVSMFVPKASGTLSGLIKALSGVPGVNDPKIGGL